MAEHREITPMGSTQRRAPGAPDRAPSPAQSAEERLLSLREAALAARLIRGDIQRRLSEGSLPGAERSSGRHWRIPAGALVSGGLIPSGELDARLAEIDQASERRRSAASSRVPAASAKPSTAANEAARLRRSLSRAQARLERVEDELTATRAALAQAQADLETERRRAEMTGRTLRSVSRRLVGLVAQVKGPDGAAGSRSGSERVRPGPGRAQAPSALMPKSPTAAVSATA